MTTPIPSPPAVPFLGHVSAIDRDLPIKSFDLLAHQYGEIFELNIFGDAISHTMCLGGSLIMVWHQCAGDRRIFVSSYELVNEVSDEKRFNKKITAGLNQVRNAAGEGLFTVSYYVHLFNDCSADCLPSQARVPGPEDQHWYIARMYTVLPDRFQV